MDEDEDDEDPGLWPGLPRARMTAGFYFPPDRTIIPLCASACSKKNNFHGTQTSLLPGTFITGEILNRACGARKQRIADARKSAADKLHGSKRRLRRWGGSFFRELSSEPLEKIRRMLPSPPYIRLFHRTRWFNRGDLFYSNISRERGIK